MNVNMNVHMHMHEDILMLVRVYDHRREHVNLHMHKYILVARNNKLDNVKMYLPLASSFSSVGAMVEADDAGSFEFCLPWRMAT